MRTEHPNLQTRRHLIQINIGWLEQASNLIGSLNDAVYSESPAAFAPHKAGSHLRHILDFYDSFLGGLESGAIDYDARARDRRTESDRAFALARIRDIAARLASLATRAHPESLSVRMEDAGAAPGRNPWLRSSLTRELQTLSSHTIHHFALIAVTLKAHGIPVDPAFGMAPSTLRFRKPKEAA